MEALRIVPPIEPLRPYVRHYVIIPSGENPGGGVFLPYSGGIISFFNEAPVVVEGTENEVIRTPRPTLFGPVGAPIEYHRRGPKQIRDVSVVLTTLGAALLCGELRELESGTCDLDSFLSAGVVAELQEKLFEAATPNSIARILNRYFLNHVVAASGKLSESLRFSFTILESNSWPSPLNRYYDVDTLKDHLHLSARHLQRIFVRVTGLTPKRYLSIVRINQVVQRMNFDPARPLSSVALEFGYVDQAHFNRDFRRYTLCTPRQFFGSTAHRENRSFMEF